MQVNQPKSFYTMFEDERKEFNYSNKGFDKVVVNFVEIETICTKCNTSFFSRSKLHKYLKTDCLGTVQVLLAPPTLPSLPIPIVEYKSILQSLGSGLALRGWTYATALITLVLQQLPPDFNPEATACLDMGYEVTLVNKA